MARTTAFMVGSVGVLPMDGQVSKTRNPTEMLSENRDFSTMVADSTD